MKTVQQKLADYLEIEGWDIETVYDKDLEWWADEIWKLKSRWSPEGVAGFVTFLVDPQHDGERKKGQGVWGIGNSSALPSSRTEAESNGTVSLVSGFNSEIEGFINQLEKLRS